LHFFKRIATLAYIIQSFMKRRLKFRLIYLLSFGLLFIALYLNFIHKEDSNVVRIQTKPSGKTGEVNNNISKIDVSIEVPRS
jgi:hypothetical protein